MTDEQILAEALTRCETGASWTFSRIGMLAFAHAIRDATLEEAAEKCDNERTSFNGYYARMVRAMKGNNHAIQR